MTIYLDFSHLFHSRWNPSEDERRDWNGPKRDTVLFFRGGKERKCVDSYFSIWFYDGMILMLSCCELRVRVNILCCSTVDNVRQTNKEIPCWVACVVTWCGREIEFNSAEYQNRLFGLMIQRIHCSIEWNWESTLLTQSIFPPHKNRFTLHNWLSVSRLWALLSANGFLSFVLSAPFFA